MCALVRIFSAVLQEEKLLTLSKRATGGCCTAKEVVSWFSQGKNEVQLEEFQSRREVFIVISAPDPHVVPGSLDLLKECCQDLCQLGL